MKKIVKIVFKSRDKWFQNKFSTFKSEQFFQKEERYNYEISKDLHEAFNKLGIESEILSLSDLENFKSKP
jgi:hypothetical protein